MKEKEPSYKIKIPVFTTIINSAESDMFGRITYKDMISDIINRIKSFSTPIDCGDSRNKTKKTIISKIDYKEYTLGEIPCLLLQISAFNTNLYDGYFEANEKIPFQKENKIGSDTNFILLYPFINGIDSNKYTNYYHALVYEDPTKDNDTIIKITKNVLSKVLRFPIRNIKVAALLEEIRKMSVIPELQMRFTGIYNTESDVDVKYVEYLHCGKMKRFKENHFKYMPVEKFQELLSEPSDSEYQQRETKLIFGKKEYKITQELVNEAKKELEETAEKIFNETIGITQDELDNKIHNHEFVIEKLSSALTSYLTNGQD